MRYLIFIFFILFSFASIANDSCVKEIIDNSDNIQSSTNQSSKVEKIQVANLFYDHSLNMKGFIKPSNSLFKNFITTLNSKIALISNDQKFYKYTYGIKPLNNSDVGKITSSESFYKCPLAADQCPKRRAKLSKILKVVEKQEDSLIIIVTDLFIGMDELIGDGINSIRNPIAAALSRGDSIGVYGVKSQYEGTISGICSGNNYNLATARPFYVFTIGPKENVLALKNIMDKDVLSKVGEENFNFNIYTNDIIKTPFVKNNWPSDIFEIGGGISTVNIFGEDLDLYQFSVDKKSDPLNINFNLEDIQTPYTLPVKDLYAEVDVSVQRKDSGTCNKDWRSYDPNKQNVVYFTEQDGTNVSFNLFDKSNNDRISLKRDKNYILNVKYRAKGVGVTSNDYWMNEWSFVCDDIGKYIESGTTFFPTLNLAALGSNLEDVQSENFEDQIISQMNIGFYLER